VSVRTVTVFGGTGFLGRRIVGHLLAHGFSVRTASRHPGPDWKLFGRDDLHRQSVEADIHNERSVAHAIAGAYGVVNAVSLYVERMRTFLPSTNPALAKPSRNESALKR